jgi:hypothetical protein
MPLVDYDRPARTCLLAALIAACFCALMTVGALTSSSTRRVAAAIAACLAFFMTIGLLVGVWFYATGRGTSADVHRAADARTIRRNKQIG